MADMLETQTEARPVPPTMESYGHTPMVIKQRKEERPQAVAYIHDSGGGESERITEMVGEK